MRQRGDSEARSRRGRRAIAAIAAALAALGAPAVARAGAISPSLLAEAQASPTQSFGVIVQSANGPGTAVDATVGALTRAQDKAFRDGVQTAKDAARKADTLAQAAAAAAGKAAKARQRATEAAAKAARTGGARDRAAAAKAQAEADGALRDAQRAQGAAAGAQGDAIVAQLDAVQLQVSLVGATSQARSNIHWQYSVIPAVNTVVSGADILNLQASADVLAVTPDSTVSLTANGNSQKWVDAMGARPFWVSPQRRPASWRTPTVAIVDSGVDGTRVQDFGGRVIGQVDLASLAPNSPGDGRGHGTMVASIAAGSSDRRSGADPDAPLISIDVLNDNGEGRMSDAIAAADWILHNKRRYNIRVANFSLQGAVESSFLFDPLAKAVEQLWFNGVVVVAAAGNYAVDGAQSGVHFSPASDPFVITVGALDIGKDGSTNNDVAAPWSAWGYTNDGFLKPEISAPGRYIIAACSPSGTLCQTGGQDPTLAPTGYVQLSGTSFAAPMVAGTAAAILALHPDWTPDQVKGQLLLTATPLPNAVPGSVGVGELDMKEATGRSRVLPPNPNLALDAFVRPTAAGPLFDVASWSSAAGANAAWNSASWSSASWASASWSSASWSSASWASASWASASWSSASWASSTSTLSLTNNALADGAGEG
jgi:hypothetical protein